MHSHNKVRPEGLRMEVQPGSSGPGPPLIAKPPAKFPHSLSPRVFWRRSCLACSLVMRFLPSRYSFIFCKGGRKGAVRLLKKQQQEEKKITMLSYTISFLQESISLLTRFLLGAFFISLFLLRPLASGRLLISRMPESPALCSLGSELHAGQSQTIS